MLTSTASPERYGRYPLGSVQRQVVRVALATLGIIVDILENHEYYGPEWTSVARSVLQDVEDYIEDEEEHKNG